MKKHQNIYDSNDPGIEIRITRNMQDKNGTVVVRGYAYDKGNCLRVDNMPVVKRTAKNVLEVPRVENIVRNLINQKLGKRKSEASRSRTRRMTISNAITNAFHELVKSDDAVCGAWKSEKTLHNHLTYFENNILPIIAQFDDEAFSEMHRQELESELFQQISKNGNSKGSQRQIQQTLNNNLAAGQTIYNRMREIKPCLPEIVLYHGRRTRNIPVEQAKSLSREVRQRFINNLEATLALDPEYVLRAVLMLDGGLRDAEACGVTPENIKRDGGNLYVQVVAQIQNNEQTNVLKTEKSYRVVPLSFWGSYMIDKCLSLLQEKSNAAADMISSPKKLSSRIKADLIKAGCDNDFFAAARKLMDCHPDLCIDGLVNMEVVSYVLRHDIASRLLNICAFSFDEIDAFLGHERKPGEKDNPVNFARSEDRKKVYPRLECFVYDPKISRNPEFCPIALVADSDLEIAPYNHTVLINDTDIPISLRSLYIRSCECNEPIFVTLPAESYQKASQINSRKTQFPSMPIGIAYKNTAKAESIQEVGNTNEDTEVSV